jgi:hypothetical protein
MPPDSDPVNHNLWSVVPSYGAGGNELATDTMSLIADARNSSARRQYVSCSSIWTAWCFRPLGGSIPRLANMLGHLVEGCGLMASPPNGSRHAGDHHGSTSARETGEKYSANAIISAITMNKDVAKIVG